MTAHSKTSVERPLSPHLQVYRWQITMALSILHRATGVALNAGLAVVVWWLLALAMGPATYDTFRAFWGSPLGMFMLVGWSFALFYHTCAGIRHMVMDTGRLFTIPEIYKGGYAMVAASVVLTAAFWIAVLA